MNLVGRAYAFDIGQYWKLNTTMTLAGLISSFYPIALVLAGVIFFILIVIAGFSMISGAGSQDAHAKEKARTFLTYAVIGMAIIFCAFWILQIINFATFGSLGGPKTPKGIL